MSSSSSAIVKSFAAGAVAALSVVWIVQRWRPHRPSPRTSTATTTSREIVFDSPHLQERMIRKAEAAILGRTSRLVVVVERCTNDFNYSAILRTVEALGIQYVYIIAPPTITTDKVLTSSTGKVVKNSTQQEQESRAMHHLFAQKSTEWLTLREFQTTAECIAALRQERYTIWATDLSQQAVCLTSEALQQVGLEIPQRLAIVFGTEAVGCTQEMLSSADERVYLPLRGFADSLNLSVATALVIQQLFVLDPTLIGAMSKDERRELRQRWYSKLAKQRILTSGQKKRKTRLQAKLVKCQELQATLDQGGTLHREQHAKLAELPVIQKELDVMEQEVQIQADAAVKDLVENPPPPISDMRRADEHRTCYVGKGTKKRNSEAWSSMPATTNYPTNDMKNSSANYFRKRVTTTTTSEAKQD